MKWDGHAIALSRLFSKENEQWCAHVTAPCPKTHAPLSFAPRSALYSCNTRVPARVGVSPRVFSFGTRVVAILRPSRGQRGHDAWTIDALPRLTVSSRE